MRAVAEGVAHRKLIGVPAIRADLRRAQDAFAKVLHTKSSVLAPSRLDTGTARASCPVDNSENKTGSADSDFRTANTPAISSCAPAHYAHTSGTSAYVKTVPKSPGPRDGPPPQPASTLNSPNGHPTNQTPSHRSTGRPTTPITLQIRRPINRATTLQIRRPPSRRSFAYSTLDWSELTADPELILRIRITGEQCPDFFFSRSWERLGSDAITLDRGATCRPIASADPIPRANEDGLRPNSWLPPS
jgi:hypothetical protein